MTDPVPYNSRPLSSAERWRAMIEAEHAQSDSAREENPPPQDHWQGLTQSFRQDPYRMGDPLVDRLLREVAPQTTLIDVGAGAGRLALPLALHCRHVTAVEPSDAMADGLRQEAERAGIRNLTVIPEPWEDARVEDADVTLCSHVLYTVRDIGSFVSKMHRLARQKVVILLFTDPPQAHLAPLWQSIHGEERLRLPAMKEFLQVLWEMGIYPDVEMQAPQRRGSFQDWEEAKRTLMRRLFVIPGTKKEGALERAMEELLEATEDGGAQVRNAPIMRAALISWRPSEWGQLGETFLEREN